MQLYPPFVHIFYYRDTSWMQCVSVQENRLRLYTTSQHHFFNSLSLSSHIPSVERVFSYSNEFFSSSFLCVSFCLLNSRFFILARPRRVVHATLNGCIECVSVNSLTHFCLSFSVPLAICSVGLGVTLRTTSYVWVCGRVTRVHNCGCDPPLGQLDECIAIFSPVIIQSTDMYHVATTLCVSRIVILCIPFSPLRHWEPKLRRINFYVQPLLRNIQ